MYGVAKPCRGWIEDPRAAMPQRSLNRLLRTDHLSRAAVCQILKRSRFARTSDSRCEAVSMAAIKRIGSRRSGSWRKRPTNDARLRRTKNGSLLLMRGVRDSCRGRECRSVGWAALTLVMSKALRGFGQRFPLFHTPAVIVDFVDVLQAEDGAADRPVQAGRRFRSHRGVTQSDLITATWDAQVRKIGND